MVPAAVTEIPARRSKEVDGPVAGDPLAVDDEGTDAVLEGDVTAIAWLGVRVATAIASVRCTVGRMFRVGLSDDPTRAGSGEEHDEIKEMCAVAEEHGAVAAMADDDLMEVADRALAEQTRLARRNSGSQRRV